MFLSIQRVFSDLLGLEVEARDLGLLEMAARALVIGLCTLAMLRLAPKRFFAARNALDLLLTFVLASMLSRAINGSAAFFPTIAVSLMLVVLHRLLSWAACRWHALGRWLKGSPARLIEGGTVDHAAMRRHHVSPHDLAEDLRLSGALEDVALVRKATLERSGEISVLRRSRVIDLPVQDGVKRVRIELDG